MRAKYGCGFLDYDNCGCDYFGCVIFMMLFGVLRMWNLNDVVLRERLGFGLSFHALDVRSYVMVFEKMFCFGLSFRIGGLEDFVI